MPGIGGGGGGGLGGRDPREQIRVNIDPRAWADQVAPQREPAPDRRSRETRICRKEIKILRLQKLLVAIGLNCKCREEVRSDRIEHVLDVHPECPLHYKQGVSVHIDELIGSVIGYQNHPGRWQTTHYDQATPITAEDLQRAGDILNRPGSINQDLPF